MKSVAVYPGQPNSVHIEEIRKPTVDDIANGRGILVKVLKVGVDATDREINDALYGNAPQGDKHLVIGHECFGVIEEVGPAVRGFSPGDYVTATVRRPGGSIYDQIGTYDMTSEETYYERGINLLHGYLTEYFVDDPEYIVKVPPGLKHLHVLMEPMSCASKAILQAFEAQRRLRVWRPRTAFVMGAGQIGLLATLILRLNGLDVYTFARRPGPRLNSEIVEGYGAHYVSTEQMPMTDIVSKIGKADIVFEATGNGSVAFQCMQLLNHNGALIWHSVTGGDRRVELPADALNLDFVLGNKLMVGSVNANREHFELGIRDLALGEAMFPGVTQRILTTPVSGLDNYNEMMRCLVEDKEALKVYVEVAD